MTSLSSQRCHLMAPVCRSSAISAWVAPGGRLPPSTWVTGYDVNTIPPATVGALVSGSPSHHDQRCSPVRASTVNTVHDSVLKTHTPSAHALVDGPSSSRLMPHVGRPVAASNA